MSSPTIEYCQDTAGRLVVEITGAIVTNGAPVTPILSTQYLDGTEYTGETQCDCAPTATVDVHAELAALPSGGGTATGDQLVTIRNGQCVRTTHTAGPGGSVDKAALEALASIGDDDTLCEDEYLVRRNGECGWQIMKDNTIRVSQGLSSVTDVTSNGGLQAAAKAAIEKALAEGKTILDLNCAGPYQGLYVPHQIREVHQTTDTIEQLDTWVFDGDGSWGGSGVDPVSAPINKGAGTFTTTIPHGSDILPGVTGAAVGDLISIYTGVLAHSSIAGNANPLDPDNISHGYQVTVLEVVGGGVRVDKSAPFDFGPPASWTCHPIFPGTKVHGLDITSTGDFEHSLMFYNQCRPEAHGRTEHLQVSSFYANVCDGGRVDLTARGNRSATAVKGYVVYLAAVKDFEIHLDANGGRHWADTIYIQGAELGGFAGNYTGPNHCQWFLKGGANTPAGGQQLASISTHGGDMHNDYRVVMSQADRSWAINDRGYANKWDLHINGGSAGYVGKGSHYQVRGRIECMAGEGVSMEGEGTVKGLEIIKCGTGIYLQAQNNRVLEATIEDCGTGITVANNAAPGPTKAPTTGTVVRGAAIIDCGTALNDVAGGAGNIANSESYNAGTHQAGGGLTATDYHPL